MISSLLFFFFAYALADDQSCYIQQPVKMCFISKSGMLCSSSPPSLCMLIGQMNSSWYLEGSKAKNKSRSYSLDILYDFFLWVKELFGDHALFNQKFITFCMETYAAVLTKIRKNINFYYVNPIMTYSNL